MAEQHADEKIPHNNPEAWTRVFLGELDRLTRNAGIRNL